MRAELDTAGRLDTPHGQLAVLLAERMAAASGAAVAALSKELDRMMAVALEGVEPEADPLDELRKRRDRKRGHRE